MAELAVESGLGAGELDQLRELCAPFRERGLLRIEGPRWRLSDPEGLALSNAVLRELLAWWEQRSAAAVPASP
ncbi:hypothetical protein [Cyanobium sp. ATX-6F1]